MCLYLFPRLHIEIKLTFWDLIPWVPKIGRTPAVKDKEGKIIKKSIITYWTVHFLCFALTYSNPQQG